MSQKNKFGFDIGRRSFLTLLGIQSVHIGAHGVGKSLVTRNAKKLQKTEKFSILQGATDTTSSQFSVVTDIGNNVSFKVKSLQDNVVGDLTTQLVKIPTSNYAVYKILVKGLNPSVKYFLEVIDSDHSVVDRRGFTTLMDGTSSAKVAILSCMHDAVYNESNWVALAQVKPEVIFMIGDSCYADFLGWTKRGAADRNQAWRRYGESRMKFRLYFESELTPVLATWDDHDYGLNNGGRDFPHKDDLMFVFDTFFAQSFENDFFKKGPIISGIFKYGGQHFALMENRYNRVTKTSPAEGFFGEEQKAWFLEHFKKNPIPTWLIQGSQWFGQYRGRSDDSSYEKCCPNVMSRFLARLKETGAKMIFVSGDVHFSEVQKVDHKILGYPTYEMTTSGMHSWTAPGWDGFNSNPNRLVSTSKHNFVMIESYVNKSGGMKGTFKSMAAGPNVLFDQSFKLE